MKIIKRIFILSFIILFSFTLNSCFVTKEQSLEELKGTYHLTENQSVENINSVENEDTRIDYLKQDEIDAYIIITGNDKGYYIYKDKNTESYIKVINLEYIFQNGIKNIIVKDAFGNELQNITPTEKGLEFLKISVLSINPDRVSRYYNEVWTKVDNCISLEYIKGLENFQNAKEFEEFAYEVNNTYFVVLDASSVNPSNLQYEATHYYHNLVESFEIMIDGQAKEAKIKIKEKDKEERITTYQIELLSSWKKIKINNTIWEMDEKKYHQTYSTTINFTVDEVEFVASLYLSKK